MSTSVREGDFVILDVNGEKLSFVQVTPKGKARIGKGFVPATALVGLPYGCLVEILEHGELQQVARCVPEQAEAPIAELRSSGQGGQAIVAALASNSATYASKTEFSQEKYRRKKSRKYCVQATLVQPTARSICEGLFAKAPMKIGHLRVDALALLLSFADIGPHSQALVWDGVGGLVTGAVGERMGGHGDVCSVYTGRNGNQDSTRLFNFPDHVRKSIHTCQLVEMQHRLDTPAAQQPVNTSQAEQLPNGHGIPDPDAAQSDGIAMEVDGAPMPMPSNNTRAAAEVAPITSSKPQPADARRQSGTGCLNKGQPLRSSFTSCIIAAPAVSPGAAWHWLRPFLAPSASFAIFSPHMQPLAEFMQTLQHTKEAVAVQLHDIWWREYQVLPFRTHPEMNAAEPGGYVLAGIKIGS
ncbi:hypothetical protein WJX74_006546 [Apatococcus lobatus]|uniref:tRNA (adenine(58)-N(1))-methyltransferase non-catalytic subunit TRM6 n=1 Tax=Apatococcus lobatus TaxID=904363 RepID=A0AAW1S6X8_9CHLO